ncbi:hypothetical protein BLOT_008088 [Blomia tropicalis]|nr:hypothetical protein BLOT_008088 [Blomia tropicalis]
MNEETSTTFFDNKSELSQTTNNEQKFFQLNESFSAFHFYIILVQLLIGICANLIILSSIGVQVFQNRQKYLQTLIYPEFNEPSCATVKSRKVSTKQLMMNSNNQLNRVKYYKLPVVDIILTILTFISLIRLITRTTFQLICLNVTCWTFYSELLCYLHGFINTFCQYLFLWIIGLFVYDRYIAHHRKHDYVCKCTHFVLYITLIDQLSCEIDWLSRYSCPYFFYTLILVIGPAYIPIIFCTFKLTKHYILTIMNNDNDQCHNSSNESQKPNSSNSIDTNMFNQQQQPNNRRSKSSMLKMCCIDAKNGSNVSQTTSTRTIQDEPRSILTSKNNSKNMVKCKQKKKKKKVSYVSTINNATILESRYVERSKTHSYRRQSRLLSKTNELLCCTICGWIILLSYTPKLLHNGSKACFNQWVPSWQIMDKFPNVNSYYKNDKMFLRMEPISEISFNISEWNEITFTMLIPLILICHEI